MSYNFLFLLSFASMMGCKNGGALVQTPACSDVLDCAGASVSVSSSSGVRGRITDQVGNLLSDITVQAGGITTVTDNRGLFHLENVPAGKTIDVFARHEGYTTAHSRVQVTSSSFTQVQLQMMAMESTYLADAEDGGLATSWSGVNIDFAEAGLVDPDGNVVSGDIEIQTGLLNAASAMGVAPGDMMAASGGSEFQLESFGMVDIRIVQDEREIQLASAATIEVPLALQGTPGDTVGLYYFDETAGRWIEEGTLTVGDDSFTAEVEHFSWWNCDQPADTQQCISGRLVDNDGNPVSGMNVKLVGVDYSTSSYANTDGNGQFCLPAKRDSRNELSAFSIEDDAVYSWTKQLSTPDRAARCGSSGCVNLGDQVVESEAVTCFRGTIRDDHLDNLGSCPLDVQIFDEDGNQVLNQSFYPDSADVCYTVPTGQTIKITGDPNIDNDPTNREATLSNVESTCSRGGCQNLALLPLYCGAGGAEGWSDTASWGDGQ